MRPLAALEEEGARLKVLAAAAAQRKVNADASSPNLEKAQATKTFGKPKSGVADEGRRGLPDAWCGLAEGDAGGGGASG